MTRATTTTPTSTGPALSTEAIEDTQVKTGGVDASSPMGYGLVINMIGKSGGNTVPGSAGSTSSRCAGTATTPAAARPDTRKINQTDFSFGGPIKQDRIWFFGAFRVAERPDGPGRTPANVATLQGALPGRRPFENTSLKSISHA